MLPTRINNIKVEYILVTDEFLFSGEDMAGRYHDDFYQISTWEGIISVPSFEFHESGRVLSLKEVEQIGYDNLPYPKDEWITREVIKAKDYLRKNQPKLYPFTIYVLQSTKKPKSVAITWSSGDLKIVLIKPNTIPREVWD